LTHDALSEQLEHFVSSVLEYCGSDSISIVSHSLGVTVSRFWLEEYSRYEVVDTFVGLAGANHGLGVCGLSVASKSLPEHHRLKPCQTIGNSSLSKTPIEELNETVGETPGDIEYYTIRGELDSLYAGCLDSPKLNGAEENLSLWVGHEGVREYPVKQIYEWVSKEE